jgi:hypothetical protein
MKTAPPPPRQAIEKATKSPMGQGKVFLFDEKTQTGTINGFDRAEYTFSIADWKNMNEKPRIGMIVNFEIGANKSAVSIKVR